MINVLESWKKSGVVDFHVKAVPGTEVPNHKDWVVSKFGRVLPILNLKDQHKNKIIKYDPSKYCHNLKKLDQDHTETVPVAQLTWHLEEGDETISKKRQGQFPVTKKPPKKKMRVQDIDSLNRNELNSSHQFSSHATNAVQTKLVQNYMSVTKKQCKEHSGNQKPITGLTSCRNSNRLSESDKDSEDEIRTIIARESVHNADTNDESEDNVEIVGDNFELKYSTHWSLQRAHNSKKVHKTCNKALRTSEKESDYDSADTDEIIAVTKTPNKKEKSETLNGSKAVKQGKDRGPKGGILIHAMTSESSDSKALILNMPKTRERAMPKKIPDKKADLEKNSITSRCKSECDESSSCLDTSGSEGDEDYKSMVQNSYRLDLTLEELGRLAGEHRASTEEETESNQSDTQSKTRVFPDNTTSSIPKTSIVTPSIKNCICPEDILSAILEGESSDEDNQKRKKGNINVRPFRGIGSLMKGGLDIHGSEGNRASSGSLDVKTLNCDSKPSHSVNDSDSHQINHKVNSVDNSESSTSSAEDSETESGETTISESEHLESLTSVSEKRKKDASITGSSLTRDKNLNSPFRSEEAFLASIKGRSKVDEKEKRLQDNAKRLTALQERQKEREQQKKMIQGALTNLEFQSTNKPKHIVFDSDNENEAEVQEVIKEGSSGNLGKEFTTKTSGKLFESSEDESDTSDEEEGRFKIKPQFEGKAGEKLMHLQSRFGTDERFRMDARFLESDSEQEDESKNLKVDEEELALEKKKNLDILKNLLHIDVEPCKLTSNAKKFKDMNTLRYDPTRQDHAVFEKKTENTEKESKAKKKKKREEAQKLPDVSKEIFYEVAADLKEVFGSTKHDEKTEIISWDKRDDVEQTTLADTETPSLTAGNNTPEGNSGFTFSFFGGEDNRSPMKEESYAIETIKRSKVAWQEDPRFQDSTSEDDEPEGFQSEAVKEDVKEMSAVQLHSNVRFFFFSQDDDRLKEGPKLFCKASDLDEDRDNWESRRQMLLEDCRKKHKDARRKVKAKQLQW
ncbi:nucleolar protein 8 isoform X2 [Sceloporus undulatus]|nr:nucleolar protein 8 isoform X2 [Sceloporus undulatus]